jgi:hypothetical protein
MRRNEVAKLAQQREFAGGWLVSSLIIHALPCGKAQTRKPTFFYTSTLNPVSQQCFGFVFRDRALFNQPQNCYLLVGNLLQSMCNGSVLSDSPLAMDIESAMFVQEDAQGWIMDLYVCGEGDTQDEARLRLDKILENLTAFFQNESAHCL